MLKEKLARIQTELKAPKDLKNEFGKYKYRNAEQIEELVKPLCLKNSTTLTITDSIELIGSRFYVKATCKLEDWESDEVVKVSAYARESDEKKGMDEAQITGACSSYARKYALCGLFLIDDSKDDPDSKDNTVTPLTKEQLTFITEHSNLVLDELKERKIKSAKQLANISLEEASELVSIIEKKIANDNGN